MAIGTSFFAQHLKLTRYTRRALRLCCQLGPRLSESIGEILYGRRTPVSSLRATHSCISAANELMRRCLERRQDERLPRAFGVSESPLLGVSFNPRFYVCLQVIIHKGDIV